MTSTKHSAYLTKDNIFYCTCSLPRSLEQNEHYHSIRLSSTTNCKVNSLWTFNRGASVWIISLAAFIDLLFSLYYSQINHHAQSYHSMGRKGGHAQALSRNGRRLLRTTTLPLPRNWWVSNIKNEWSWGVDGLPFGVMMTNIGIGDHRINRISQSIKRWFIYSHNFPAIILLLSRISHGQVSRLLLHDQNNTASCLCFTHVVVSSHCFLFFFCSDGSLTCANDRISLVHNSTRTSMS